MAISAGDCDGYPIQDLPPGTQAITATPDQGVLGQRIVPVLRTISLNSEGFGRDFEVWWAAGFCYKWGRITQ